MLLHLESVLSGKTDTMHVEVPLESSSFPAESFLGAGISYKLAGDRDNPVIDFIISSKGEKKVSICAKADINCKARCSRCLKPVEFPLALEFVREIDVSLTEEQRREAMDEMDFIYDFSLDTELLLQEEIMLNLPMQILCKEDCKGLCPTCGINRNKEVCHCEDMPKDPRMAVISELFRQSMEENKS